MHLLRYILVDKVFFPCTQLTSNTMFRLLKQLTFRLPIPEADFSGKTVVLAGANVGFGKEAMKHFVRRGAAKVVATVRSSAKGNAALTETEADTRDPDVAVIWELGYSSYASVKKFCTKVAEFDRVDAVVLNAAVATMIFEGDESSITVNVISTTLLAVLFLPTLRAMAIKSHIVPTLTITGSEVHSWAKYP